MKKEEIEDINKKYKPAYPPYHPSIIKKIKNFVYDRTHPTRIVQVPDPGTYRYICNGCNVENVANYSAQIVGKNIITEIADDLV